MSPQEFSTCREVECPQEPGCQWHSFTGEDPELGNSPIDPATLCTHFICRQGFYALRYTRQHALNPDENGCPTVTFSLRGRFRIDENGDVFQMNGDRRVYVGVKI